MKMVTLTLEIPDEVYAVCEREAAQTGRTVEQCVMEFLLKHAPRPAPALTDEQRRQAQERLERYLGAGRSGDPRSADNERLDADLVREYLSSHEEAH
jgi:hypothetical protein